MRRVKASSPTWISSRSAAAAVGDTTVAIHWDYAREVLQKADGVIATVGLEAEESPPAAFRAPI
jgi:hypothetical protein